MNRTVEQLITPADDLRRRITQAEILAANVKGAGSGALTLLELLDQIDARGSALSGAGVDLRSEQGRVDGLHAVVRRKKRGLLRELGGPAVLASMRGERHPPAERWWWFLDVAVAQENRQELRRTLTVAGVVVLILGMAAFVYLRFFQPDPTELAIFQNTNAARALAGQGEWAQAIAQIQENEALAPGQPEWPIRLSVLYTLAGDDERAQVAAEEGRRRSGSEAEYLINRGQFFLEVDAYELALESLQPAEALDPSSAATHYFLGRAYAGLGQRAEALDAFERAGEVAGKGEESIYVMSRMEMSQLLLSPNIGPPGETPAP